VSAAQPITQAFLLCDRVITEQGSNKKTIVGVFGIMQSPAFPIHHHTLALYYRAVMEKGDFPFRIEFSPRGKADVLSRIEGELHIGRGDIPTELAVNLPYLVVPAPAVRNELSAIVNQLPIGLMVFDESGNFFFLKKCPAQTRILGQLRDDILKLAQEGNKGRWAHCFLRDGLIFSSKF